MNPACSNRTGLTTITLLLTAVTALPAQDLGTRTAIDAAAPQTAWQTSEGVTVDAADGRVTLRCAGSDYGSARPAGEAPLAQETVLVIDLDALDGRVVRVQAQWQDADGKFIEATRVAELDAPTDAPLRLDLTQQMPAGVEAAHVGMKVWVIDDGTEATFTALRIEQPRRWQSDDLETFGRVEPASAKLNPGEHVTTEVGDDGVNLSLGAATQSSGTVFRPTFTYERDAHAMMDLTAVKGGRVTLVLLCFDGDDQYLDAAPLFKGLREAGLYEVALSESASEVPEGTQRVGFKLWLIGETPSARVAGFYLGRPRSVE